MTTVPSRLLQPINGLRPRPVFAPLPAVPATPAPTPTTVVAQVTDPLLTRTAYFDGRLLTADDLIRDQQYLDERLLEAGRVGGDGVVQGLALSLDASTQKLHVKAGVAITPLGRALVLDQELVVDLGDRAAISRLNDGASAHFPAGMYAVVLQYAEKESGLAEAYPTDLGSARTLHADSVMEGVEAVLVPLGLPVPPGGEAAARAQLALRVIGQDALSALLPDDGVALGVLALRDDAPRWVDADLLRHPRRLPFAPNIAVADLSRQYDTLVAEVRSERSGAGLSTTWAASDYFHRLPPYGSLAKDAFDPSAGTQGFFPEQISVWVAPVRRDDLAAIRREAADLDWIDLDAGEPAEVLVLAALDPAAYATFVNRLEAPADPLQRLLPRLDGLLLRVVGAPPVHRLDTDAGAWQELWNGLKDADVVYVRRQPRASELGVAGIVLARGYAPPLAQPAPGPAPQPEPAPEPQPSDENVVFLEKAASTRAVSASDQTAAKQVLESARADAGRAKTLTVIVQAIPSSGDPALWPTLVAALGNGSLDTLAEMVGSAARTPAEMVDIVEKLQLGDAVVSAWKQAAEAPEKPLVPPAAAQERLAVLVKARGAASKTASANVVKAAGSNADALTAVLAILDAVDPAGDKALWPTLVATLKAGTTSALAAAVAGGQASRTPKEMLAILTRLKATATVLKAWQALA